MPPTVLDTAPLDALADDLGSRLAVASMLSTFCDSLHVLRETASGALRRSDLPALRQALRDLSASAGMFGAEHLAALARELAERVGGPDEVTDESLRVLERECVAVRQAVRRYLGAAAYGGVPSPRDGG